MASTNQNQAINRAIAAVRNELKDTNVDYFPGRELTTEKIDPATYTVTGVDHFIDNTYRDVRLVAAVGTVLTASIHGRPGFQNGMPQRAVMMAPVVLRGASSDLKRVTDELQAEMVDSASKIRKGLQFVSGNPVYRHVRQENDGNTNQVLFLVATHMFGKNGLSISRFDREWKPTETGLAVPGAENDDDDSSI